MIKLSMPEIKRLETIAQNSKDCLSFSQGALRVGGIDQEIKEYVRQILHSDKTDYYNEPAGIFTLREKLAQNLSKKHQKDIGTEHVLISHGATGALASLCATLLEQGDQAIILEPAYPIYQSVVKINKAQPVFVPAFSLKQDDSGNQAWTFDIGRVEQAITPHTKMIIFSNPSNPTGVFLNQQELLQLKELCEHKKIYLVVDQVYENFVFDGQFCSVTPWALESDFVIQVGSFSKSFAMSGWRVGYVVGTPALISAMTMVQAYTIGCPSSIGQYGVLYGLEHEDEIVPGLREKVLKSRDIACTFFDELQERRIISYAKPPASFYIFFQLTQHDSMAFVMEVLKEAKVVMVPGTDFGPHFGNFVRFCYAREPVVVVQGVKRLKEYFIFKSREKGSRDGMVTV